MYPICIILHLIFQKIIKIYYVYFILTNNSLVNILQLLFFLYYYLFFKYNFMSLEKYNFLLTIR